MEDIYKVLGQLHVRYQRFDHPAVFTVAESKDLHLKIPGAHTKNLFLRNKKKTNYYLVAVLADKKVNLNQLTKELEEDRLSFGSPPDLQKYLGVSPGSVSVFGLINDKEHKLKVIVDNDFFKHEKIGFHPNDNTATLIISIDDLKKFLESTSNKIIYRNI